eukprot:CAMPEP_0118720420 /NCGR_PEP_ID=MMETSP0800-20121206/30098_1 /TAXON_ID=210618 ORGANISM="Striatella unipunctata, Strain CCMP2910" /NCGR_SAMPLE_ID=MMETSP0800 /ASSEMBLY_ACC=CAM_ASM_000638 /LENGTH=290 /DNA_ID=CAMNT_0006628053 /DNA_START=268 /DNA_END=1140 /DNA_ORIENTATION=-
MNRKRFVYYTRKLPRFLRNQPNGNLLRAISLGMELREMHPAEYDKLFTFSMNMKYPPPSIEAPVKGNSLWVPSGAACGVAISGCRLLSREIYEFWEQHGKGRPLSVCLPSGTCTTGLFLHREMTKLVRENKSEMDIKVVVIPCVGDDTYAVRQMMDLDRSTGGSGQPDDLPDVLTVVKNENSKDRRQKFGKYFTFGKPTKTLLDIYVELKDDHGLLVDLLYGAPAWGLLFQHWRTHRESHPGLFEGARTDDSCPIAGRQVMYVHSGGLEGISSQLVRYKHAGMINAKEIQ